MSKWIAQFYSEEGELVAEESVVADSYDDACAIADSMLDDFGADFYELS